MDVSPVGPLLTLLGTFAGVWVVVLLFRWIQRDFVNRYRKELEDERRLRQAAELAEDRERRARIRSDLRVAVLEGHLARNGVQIPDDPIVPLSEDLAP